MIKEGRFKKLHGGAFGNAKQTRELKLNREGMLVYYDGQTPKGHLKLDKHCEVGTSSKTGTIFWVKAKDPKKSNKPRTWEFQDIDKNMQNVTDWVNALAEFTQ